MIESTPAFFLEGDFSLVTSSEFHRTVLLELVCTKCKKKLFYFFVKKNFFYTLVDLKSSLSPNGHRLVELFGTVRILEKF